MRDYLQDRIYRLLEEPNGRRFYSALGEIYVGVSPGKVRKSNQDRAIVVSARYANSPDRDFILVAVCDGMGGMERGGEAAALALSTFVTKVLRSGRRPPDNKLMFAALDANDAVFAAMRGNGGTTLSALLIDRNSKAIGLNVGDSRIFAIKNRNSLEQLSRDDTLREHLMQNGRGQSADNIPGGHQLVQFIGVGEGLEPNLIFIPNDAATDGMLITTDGAHGAPNKILSDLVAASKDYTELPRRLVEFSDLMGGRDNATAIFIPRRDGLFKFVSDADIGATFYLSTPTSELEIWLPTLANNEVMGRDEPAPEDERRGHPEKVKKPTEKTKRTGKKPKKSAKDKNTGDVDHDTPLLDIKIK